MPLNFIFVGNSKLQNGADPSSKSGDGKTPMELAKEELQFSLDSEKNNRLSDTIQLLKVAEEKQPKTSFLSKHKGKIGIGVGIGMVASIVVGAVLGFTTTISLPVLAIIGIALVSGFIAGGIVGGVAYMMSQPNAEQHAPAAAQTV